MEKELVKLKFKNKLETADLDKSLNKAIYSLKIINQIPMEVIVSKLIKDADYPMTELEILDKLYFINNIDRNRLNLILNYYNYIHTDINGYYYSEKKKNIKNQILNIISKLKYVEELTTLEAVYILLSKFNRPLKIDEIQFYLDIFYPIDRVELKKLILSSSDFKLIEHNTYALAEWKDYHEINYDFYDDLNIFKTRGKISKRNWEIFRKYKLSIEKTTLQEVGNEYNLTRERVRQITKKINKKLTHPINKKSFNKYIFLLDELIEKYGVLSLEHNIVIPEINEIFGEINIIEIINFLNFIDNRFIIIDNKYCYKRHKYYRSLNYLDYLIERLGETPVGSKNLDDIYRELEIGKWREKILIKFLINKDDRFYIDENKETCYYTKNSFRGIGNILYIILNEIGEPTHYLVIAEKYEEITGEKTNPRTILSYMDRRKDLFTRTFIGTYALREWDHDEHIFTMDLVIDLLEEKQCIMHYEDIYEFIKNKTESKKQTMYNQMQMDDRVASLGCGYYGLASYIEDSSNNLKYYSNIIDRDNKRRYGYLLGKGINKYGHTFIVYRVTGGMFNSYSIRIPGVFNINLDFDVYGFDCDYNRYGFRFYKDENNLYGINNFFKKKEIEELDIIVVEIIGPNIIRIFTEAEYKEEYEVFNKDKYEEYVNVPIIETGDEEIIEVVDLKTLLKFGLKYGYVYYDDLRNIDLLDQYEDIFDLMADLDERGVRFR